jgi:DeoR/GlpR family transcriptional regulator of sugar metabolism
MNVCLSIYVPDYDKKLKKQYFLYDSSKIGKRFAFKLCSVENLSGEISNKTALL